MYCVPGLAATNYESVVFFYAEGQRPGRGVGPIPRDEIAKGSDPSPRSLLLFADLSDEAVKNVNYGSKTVHRYAAFGYRMTAAEVQRSKSQEKFMKKRQENMATEAERREREAILARERQETVKSMNEAKARAQKKTAEKVARQMSESAAQTRRRSAAREAQAKAKRTQEDKEESEAFRAAYRATKERRDSEDTSHTAHVGPMTGSNIGST